MRLEHFVIEVCIVDTQVYGYMQFRNISCQTCSSLLPRALLPYSFSMRFWGRGIYSSIIVFLAQVSMHTAVLVCRNSSSCFQSLCSRTQLTLELLFLGNSVRRSHQAWPQTALTQIKWTILRLGSTFGQCMRAVLKEPMKLKWDVYVY